MLFRFRKIMAMVLVLLPMHIVSAADFVNVIGANTVAGSPTLLKASKWSAGALVNFIVQKPDGLVLTLPAKADDNGLAQVELYDYHTKVAGKYGLSAYQAGNGGNYLAVKSSFEVYAGELDQTKSHIGGDRSMIKSDGQDSAKIKVVLKDKFENPIVGRVIKLISSRNEDKITAVNPISNGEGVSEFTVTSSKSGIAYLSVLDATEMVPLEQRVQVSFIDSDSYVANAGGNIIKTAYAADVGPLTGFELSDFPATVKPNENITFKVKAVDASAQIVQDYTGSIRFSAEGDNSSGVTLPANYKFLAEDLGQHQFNLGLSFTQVGTYKIVVNDVNDKFKKGEKTVVVANAGATGTSTATTGTNSADKATITSPVAGTYSQSQQTISGKAKASSNVKVFDNNKEIGSVIAGTTGKFSLQTPALTDGKHSIYVVNTDSISLEVLSNSDPVEISIDTTAPKIDELQLDPSKGIKAGSVINVKVYSEAKLSQAALIFNSDIVALNASIDDPSVYIGTIQAPAQPGAYPLNVLLADELQNEKTYENQATINVDPAGGVIEKTVTDKVDTTKPVDTTKVDVPVDKPVDLTGTQTGPGQVSGLIAYGSDKRVTLVWDAASSLEKKVKAYKVYYGENVKDLSKNIVTKDASTTWYIPDLENGKEYFFAVSAIDQDGAESLNRSEIVSGIPFMLEIKNALTNTPTKSLEDTDLKSAAYSGPLPSTHSKSGPELLWLLVPSLGLAGVLKRKF